MEKHENELLIDSHLKNLAYEMYSLQKLGTFCDCVLKIGRESISVHTVVMAACSPVFSEKTSVIDIKNSDKCNLTLDLSMLDGVYLEEVLCVVKFCYTGLFEMKDCHSVSALRKLGEFLSLESIIDKCKEDLCNVDHRSNSEVKEELPIDHIENLIESKDIEDIENLSSDDKPQQDVSIHKSTRSRKRGRPRKIEKIEMETVKDESMEDDEDNLISGRDSLLDEESNHILNEHKQSGNSHQKVLSHRKLLPKKEKKRKKLSSKKKVTKTTPRKMYDRCKYCESYLDPATKETADQHEKECPEAKLKKHKGSKCKKCKLTFSGVGEFLNHCKNVHEKAWQCHQCEKGFQQEDLLIMHQFKQHNTPIDNTKHSIFTCREPGCDYLTIVEKNYLNHQESHTESTHITCTLCGKSYKSKASLYSHKKKIHSSNPPPKESCDECGKEFKNKTTLESHKKWAHGKNKDKYLCNHCPYSVRTPREFYHHLMVEHNMDPPNRFKKYVCSICGYKTLNKNYYEIHTRKHTGEKPFQCTECGHAFTSQSELSSHSKWHQDREHKCQYCDHKAVDKSKLKKHLEYMHTKRDLKPWKCHVCDYKSNIKGNLRLHLRKVHKLEIQTQRHLIQDPEKIILGRTTVNNSKDQRKRKRDQSVSPEDVSKSCQTETPSLLGEAQVMTGPAPYDSMANYLEQFTLHQTQPNVGDGQTASITLTSVPPQAGVGAALSLITSQMPPPPPHQHQHEVLSIVTSSSQPHNTSAPVISGITPAILPGGGSGGNVNLVHHVPGGGTAGSTGQQQQQQQQLRDGQTPAAAVFPLYNYHNPINFTAEQMYQNQVYMNH